MNYHNITTAAALQEYCRTLAGCPTIALDVEFVSERTFRPVLCLIQVAAGDELAVIDPLSADTLKPFWELLAAPGHVTVVHAGRGEVEFSLQAIGRAPAGLFDVQLAAGLTGIEYPAAYQTLVSRLLGQRLKKHETRTDWLRRPLSKRQIEYALEDVLYLPALYNTLQARLQDRGRTAWMQEETGSWLADVEQAISHERWRRISGNAALEERELAILRELFHWREQEAQRRNQPARRVLRDDLMVELARRQSTDPRRIGAVRGMERGDLQKRLPQLAACIQRGLNVPEDQLPVRTPGHRLPQLSVLGQLLFAALGSLCRQAELAPALVGTPNDLRELIAYRAHKHTPLRAPTEGWSGEVQEVRAEGVEQGSEVRGQGSESDTPLSTGYLLGGLPPCNASPHPSPLPRGEGTKAARGEGTKAKKIPRLACGWRAELIGGLFEDLLSGKLAIRITDPQADAPLAFEKM